MHHFVLALAYIYIIHYFISSCFYLVQGSELIDDQNSERQRTMENDQEALSRPSIPFSVGLCILLLMLLSITAFFFCCLHWDKLRSLFLSSSYLDQENPEDIQSELPHESPQKPKAPIKMAKQNQPQSLPVLMPGDHVPKFVAVACPCEPAVVEKFTVVVHKPT